MTEMLSGGDAGGQDAAEGESIEERLARAEERLAFYASFDQLIHDNISQASHLMRDALELRERTQAEIDAAWADADRRVEAERARLHGEVESLHGELVSLQAVAAGVARRAATTLGELGLDVGPVTRTPAASVAPEQSEAAAEAGAARAGSAMEGGAAAAADGDRETEQSEGSPASGTSERSVAYSGTGTGELRLETLVPSQESAAAGGGVEGAIPSYPSFDDGDDEDGETSAAAGDAQVVGAWPAEGAFVGDADEAAAADEARAAGGGETATAGRSQDDGAPGAGAEETPPLRAAEGGGAAVEADPAAAAVGEARSRAVMVLVHGVPRAAAALSLQRHLHGLAHVESVEAREYAEGILRLQVMAVRALHLDDLRSWDGGTELVPVTVTVDVVEVRLPGALGF